MEPLFQRREFLQSFLATSLALGPLAGPALTCHGAEPKLRKILFSTRKWEGDYVTIDTPGKATRTESTGAIYSIDETGHQLQKIVELGGRTEYPIASPDGNWVYFQSNATGKSQVYRCRWDGTDVTNLTAGEPLGKSWQESFGIFLSHDGKQLLYTVHDGNIGRVVLANADGSEPRFFAPHLGYTYMASLSQKADYLVFSGPARNYRLLIAKLPDGEPTLLTPDHPDSYAPQFTPDGQTIIFFRRDGDIYSVAPNGNNLRQLTSGNRYVEFRLSQQDQHGSTDGPQISPSGQSIAFMAVKDGVSNIHLIDIDGTHPRQLTFRPTNTGRVLWSPNGKDLAFVSFIGKYPQLFVISAQGGEPRQITDFQDQAVYFPQWAPMIEG